MKFMKNSRKIFYFLFFLSVSFINNFAKAQVRPEWAPPEKKDRPAQDRYGCTTYTEDLVKSWTLDGYWSIFREQAKVLSPHMANKDHRLWHYLWHTTRDQWNGLSPAQKKVFTDVDPKWNVLRPNDKRNPDSAAKNRSGEDFLYMHNYMVRHAQSILMSSGQPCISSWRKLPQPDDKIFPVVTKGVGRPQEFFSGTNDKKGMVQFFGDFTSEEYLKKNTLGEIGSRLENTLHNRMHMRWTADTWMNGSSTEGPRTRASDPLSPENSETWIFNKPEYNLLLETYSSHVNPTFFKIHMLVDDVIYLWLKVNNFTRIAENCGGDKTCYEWVKEPFGGPFPTDFTGAMTADAGIEKSLEGAVGGARHASHGMFFVDWKKLQDGLSKLPKNESNSLRCMLDRASFMDFGTDEVPGATSSDNPTEFLRKHGAFLYQQWVKRNSERTRNNPSSACNIL